MNEDENKVLIFLRSFGYKDIFYEPDGNQPPDFLVDGEIAVEARRLNQFFIQNGRTEPIEKLEFSLEPRLRKLFNSYRDVDVPNSSFVMYNYSRPLTVTKNLMNRIKEVFDEQINWIDSIKEYNVGNNLTVKFLPSDQRDEQVYLFGSKYDKNKGGFVVNEISRSLQLILEEKEEKIKPYFNRYNEWWLVLINTLYLDNDRIGINQLREGFVPSELFNKIYIVSQIDPKNGFQL